MVMMFIGGRGYGHFFLISRSEMVLIAFPVRNLILLIVCRFVRFFVGDSWMVCCGSIGRNWHEVAVLVQLVERNIRMAR